MLEAGIQPDILVCRSEHKLSKEVKNKLALFATYQKILLLNRLMLNPFMMSQYL